MKIFTWKTTVTALVISFFGALGLFCFLNWFSIVAFGERSRYPIEYPLSIVVGFISFLAFVIAIIQYIKFRKQNGRWIGILPDAVISIITLPAFGLLVSEVYFLF